MLQDHKRRPRPAKRNRANLSRAGGGGPVFLRPMDQFRAEWKSMKRDVERQLALFGPPSGMRTTDENGNDTTKASKERLGRIIKELDELLKAHELSPNRRAE